ncbi:MAG: DUF11 domain-containing protein, partial [Cyclobacteriaceae bacterium]|nr:DUF11 domain-containing protein [Cyclobacteriaceae bacterium]
TNTATATAIFGETELEESDDATVEAIQLPALSIEKTADQSSYDAVGDELTYQIVVTNTGNVTLTNIVVSDPLTGLDETIETLAPGAENAVTFVASYTVTQEDLDNGSFTNTATATAIFGETELEESDDATVEAIQLPAISITKSADVSTVDAVGDVITYTLTISNTGNVTLTGVTVEDPLTGLDLAIGNLVPGQIESIETEYIVTQEDINSGSILNVATVKGNLGEQEVSDSDEEEVIAERNPGISLNKTVDVESVSRAGVVLNYTLAVTNTGNVTLTGGNLVDPRTGLSLDGISLEVGETKIFTTSYTVTIQDILSGVPIVNIANVEANDPLTGIPYSAQSQAIVNLNLTPAINIVKVADKQQVSEIGEEIVYTLTVTNTGTAPLSNVTVVDPLTGLNQNLGLMLPDEVKVIESQYVVTQGDLNKGSILNVATATGSFLGTEATDSDDALVQALQAPAIAIEKSANVSSVDEAGDVITYTLTITNAGNVTLTSVKITDPLTGYDNLYGEMVPGQVVEVQTSYTVTQSDIDSGSILNVATAEGFNGDTKVSDSAEAVVTAIQNPAIDIEITDNNPVLENPGDEIPYTIVVTNTGNVTLDNVTVVDTVTGTVVNVGTLAPGESKTIEVSYPITQEDIDRGNVKNEATATGESPNQGDDDPTATDEVTTPILYRPEIQMVKTSDKNEVREAGEVITYTLTVTNTGNVTMSDVTISDPLTGLNQQIGTLSPGQVVSVVTTYTVTIQDLEGSSIVNVAVVTAKGPRDGDVIEDKDEVSVGIGANEIIANDDEYGAFFLRFGGVIGNILDNDRLKGQRPDPSDVDFEFTDLDGIVGL